MLAQQALEVVAGKLPRQQAFRTLVDALHKEQQDGMGEAPIVQVHTAEPTPQPSQAYLGLKEPPSPKLTCSVPRCHGTAGVEVSR